MSRFRIKTMVLGAVSTNCYLVYHEDTKEAILFDPADGADQILKVCSDEGLKLQAVLLTHGHFDHIFAVNELVKQLKIPLYGGRKEKELLEDSNLNLSASWMKMPYTVKADYLVEDGQILTLSGFSLRVIETPGHTAGSLCYYFKEEDVLISGDTLFLESLGRTDVPTSNPQAIIHSITDKLFLLPDDTIVYPGHGEPTSIGYEKEHNPAAAYRNR